MDIIFLEIVGVLDSHNSYLYWHRNAEKRIREFTIENLCLLAVNNLNYLIEKSPNRLGIVLTSNVFSEDLDFYKSYFKEFGFLYPETILEILPRVDKSDKSLCIMKWLKFNEFNKYLIIDSMESFSSEFQTKMVVTDPFVGFSVKNVLESLAILNNKWE